MDRKTTKKLIGCIVHAKFCIAWRESTLNWQDKTSNIADCEAVLTD